MRFRLLFIGVMSCLLSVLFAVPTATASASPLCHHCSTGIPAGVPALDHLAPASSTTVHAGDVVSIAANYIQVEVRPFSVMTYRGPRGTISEVPFDTDTFTLTVPADWRPGRYTLVKIVTTTFGTGTQYRNHRFVGTTADSPPRTVCGRSDLNLKVLDLRVLKS